MKKFASYLLIVSVFSIIVAGLINWYYVRDNVTNTINDSLKKAREAKKAKADLKKEQSENEKVKILNTAEEDAFNNEFELINNK